MKADKPSNVSAADADEKKCFGILRRRRTLYVQMKYPEMRLRSTLAGGVTARRLQEERKTLQRRSVRFVLMKVPEMVSDSKLHRQDHKSQPSPALEEDPYLHEEKNRGRQRSERTYRNAAARKECSEP